ncbi:MAG: S49 family peptidase [Proteobacteria bacterium]|nr:S49 family peptidase [Pseudomonadota bacterium]
MNEILKIAKYWAIEPDYLKSISRESLSTKSERSLDNTRTVSIRDGIAIIPIHGVITAKNTLFSLFAGGTSLETLAKDFREALNNEDVKSILFDIDSPGGVAVGPFEMAEMIYNARGQKPIYSYIGRNGSSAAYWLASATEKIIVNPSALVGSIGVVTTIPVQEQPDSEGYKNIEITSSNASLKRPDPRTQEGITEIKRGLDDLESAFIGSIAKYRSVTTDIIKSDFGSGGVVMGEQAVNRNMADALGTYEEVLTNLNQNNQMSKQSELHTVISKEKITASYIKSEFPNVAQEIINESSDSIRKKAIDEGVAIGAKNERDRILAIESASLPGHEDLIEEAKKDGSITAEKLALRIINAEKQKGSSYLANSKISEAELPEIQPNVEAKKESQEVDANLPLEQRAKTLWDKDVKLRAEFGDDFESYHAFAKAYESNQVRILNK